MDLAIIVLSYNTRKLLLECLKSIYKSKPSVNFEVVVVDNFSTDSSVEAVKKYYPRAKIIVNKKNLGFSAGNNVALKVAKAKYILLLNSDTLVRENALNNLLAFAKNSPYGIVSCKLLNPEGSFQPNAGDLPTFFPVFTWLSGLDDILPINLPSFHKKYAGYYYPRQVGWVSGTAMLITKETLAKVGLFDERLFMYAEDCEYCLRASKAGIKVGWTNQASIMHLGGASSKEPRFSQWLGEFKGLLYIYQKHFGALARFLLKLMIYFFIIIRYVCFSLVNKRDAAKIYGKILFTL